MGPIDFVGLSRADLYTEVQGAVWLDWTAEEPLLASIDRLEDLRHLRGREADQILGAVVRLAASDRGDDWLATAAVCHQLAGPARRLAVSLRDLSRDMDTIIAGGLWIEIKRFPWRTRRRAYATSLILQTRAAVLDLLLPTRVPGASPREVAVDPLSPMVPWAGLVDAPTHRLANSRHELLELLEWALDTRTLSRADVTLLMELVAAGEELGDRESPHMRQGVASQAAVHMVAAQRGVSERTVRRHRDRILESLRAAAPMFLVDVA